MERERAGHGLRTEPPGVGGRIVALLPGSRIVEIQRILPRLLKAVGLLPAAKGAGAEPPLRIAIPAANDGAERAIRKIVSSFDGLPPMEILRGGARDILKKASCAAVASGTATLEAALARCPTVLVYAVSPLLAWFARRVITGVKHVGLVNVVAEKCGFAPPMPELLQEAFTPEAVAARLETWLDDDDARELAAKGLEGALSHLRAEGEPLETAAREILAHCTGVV